MCTQYVFVLLTNEKSYTNLASRHSQQHKLLQYTVCSINRYHQKGTIQEQCDLPTCEIVTVLPTQRHLTLNKDIEWKYQESCPEHHIHLGSSVQTSSSGHNGISRHFIWNCRIFVGGFRIYMSMPSVAPAQHPQLAAAESFARTWVIDCYFA